MKKIIITQLFDKRKKIGTANISEKDLPRGINYHFEVGGIVKEKIGNRITNFELLEISLVPDIPFGDERITNLRPKGWNAKHFEKWMRKGKCPGCGVDCGAQHQENCCARNQLLRELKRKKL